MMSMSRFAWLTDIHLNFLERSQLARFCIDLLHNQPDGVFISGDIAESHNLERYLQVLERTLDRPIWFVLGNHDFYRGSILQVRNMVAEMTRRSAWLRWLPAVGVVELSADTCLLGHDGWADGRCGDYEHSEVMLNDYWLIAELANLSAKDRLTQLHALGDETAAYFRRILPDALARYRHVYVLIHPPPFAEACWYQGRQSGPGWLPHLACRAAGVVLLEAMQTHADRHMTVLCGHTHGAGEVRVLPNLHVITGGAEYGAPQMQRIIEVENCTSPDREGGDASQTPP
jgi:predicted phosphohydrolase